MKARFIFREREECVTRRGRVVVIEMDLYQVVDAVEARRLPQGYRFSWIAFDRDNPEERVLFDCHPPKGPHFHIDSDPVGVGFIWSSLESAVSFFERKVYERFGEIVE